MNENRKGLPGVTLRSVSVTLFAILVVSILIVFGEVIDGTSFKGITSIGVFPLSPAAVLVFVAFSLVSAGIYALFRFRFLSRQELLCILFALLMAAPIVSYGYWGRHVGYAVQIQRRSDYDVFDALNDKLWPHGPDLIQEAFEQRDPDIVTTIGNVSWEEVEYDKGESAILPVIRNDSSDDVSAVRIRVPIHKGGKVQLLLGEPYHLAAAARARGLGANSEYYCKVYYDDSEDFAEQPFIARSMERVTVLHQTGFQSFGAWGMSFSPGVEESITVEFGLDGEGEVTFALPRLRSVRALEVAFTGRQSVTAEEYEGLSDVERAGVLVRPDSLVSPEGLRFVLLGYIPWDEWLQSMTVWFTYILLIVLATYAIAALMRRQWVENERYPLPLLRVPSALLGDPESEGSVLPPIWRNHMMWLGFGVTLFWCVMRGWAKYNPNVPDMNVDLRLMSYFDDPRWGKMWDFSFTVSALILGLAIFMELNVLLSLVVGFFLFRMQYWVGEANGWAVVDDYPFEFHQEVAGFLTYAVLVLIFTRKYIWKAFRFAVAGKKKDPERDALSYRAAFFLLVATIMGAGAWTLWVGESLFPSMLLFLSFIAIAFVAAKIRAECGMPSGQYYPTKAWTMLPLLGGMSVFGPKTMVFAGMACTFIGAWGFMVLSGLQFEFIELGLRTKVRTRHLLAASLIGLVGGFLIGGWVHLSALYALGQDDLTNKIAYTGDFAAYRAYLKDFVYYTQELTEPAAAEEGQSMRPYYWAYLYAGSATTVVTILRQLYAGFWFHPIGILVGPTLMAKEAWGSILMAWLIRFLVLKLGGAAAVREKLFPFAIGVFLAAVAAYVIFSIYSGYLLFFNPGVTRQLTFF